MKIEELKIGQTVFVKGIITDIKKDEILDLEIHTSENNFYVNSSDVYASVDQPKPVVPQFVADWYEEHKDKLEEAICSVVWLVGRFGSVADNENWFTETENAIQTIINMHQFGYTVEKEKLYTVEIPTNSEAKLALIRRADRKVVITIPGGGEGWRRSDSFQLTEQEIRKDFDWAWQWKREVSEL